MPTSPASSPSTILIRLFACGVIAFGIMVFVSSLFVSFAGRPPLADIVETAVAGALTIGVGVLLLALNPRNPTANRHGPSESS